MVQGEIWWAHLPKARGSEPAKKRPIILLQADSFNRSAIGTIVCAVVTTNLALITVPGCVHLTKSESKLPKESVINLSQIITLDRHYLQTCVGAVSRRTLEKVKESLRLVLDV